jgi:hypothetical protein
MRCAEQENQLKNWVEIAILIRAGDMGTTRIMTIQQRSTFTTNGEKLEKQRHPKEPRSSY